MIEEIRNHKSWASYMIASGKALKIACFTEEKRKLMILTKTMRILKERNKNSILGSSVLGFFVPFCFNLVMPFSLPYSVFLLFTDVI